MSVSVSAFSEGSVRYNRKGENLTVQLELCPKFEWTLLLIFCLLGTIQYTASTTYATYKWIKLPCLILASYLTKHRIILTHSATAFSLPFSALDMLSSIYYHRLVEICKETENHKDILPKSCNLNNNHTTHFLLKLITVRLTSRHTWKKREEPGVTNLYMHIILGLPCGLDME